MIKQRIHLVFGPTASGKSAHAVALAQANHGVIINADATQLYGDLRVLSARPSAQDEALAPHRLYGVLAGDTPASVASWLVLATAEIRTAWQQQKLPIVCGGTGMYLAALQHGLSPIPPVPEAIRQQVAAYSNAEIHAQLCHVDPLAAAKLNLGDTQRLRRAYEVWKATGKPLSAWQAAPKIQAFAEAEVTMDVLNPPREEVYSRINARFLQMMQQGAEAEVIALLAQNYPPHAPVMKAVGVPEISAFLRGECSRPDAIAKAQQHSRNYAKRQITWLNNQFNPSKLS